MPSLDQNPWRRVRLVAAHALAGELVAASWEADQLPLMIPDSAAERIEAAFPFESGTDRARFREGPVLAGLGD